MLYNIDTVGKLVGILETLECPDRLVDTLRISNCHSLGCAIGTTDEGELIISSAFAKYTPKIYDEYIIIGSEATVAKLIRLFKQVPGYTRIKDIRIKGASNVVFMEVTEFGLVAHD